jgi:hypothetical protein
MKKRATLVVAMCVPAFLLFFFFLAPVVWMAIIPCQHYGYGYSSISRALFNVGVAYLNGHLFWMTENYRNCI